MSGARSGGVFAAAASVAVLLACGPTLAAPPVEPTIAAVQGRGHASPLAGRRLTLRGVVTAVDADARRPGFWMQSLEDDGDAATAEALRVDTSGVPSLEVGSVAAVDGMVVEGPDRPGELRVTRLVEASWRVVEHRRTLPSPVSIRPPSGHVDDDGLTLYEPALDAIDYFESLEGMRVQVERPVVVGPTNHFRECVVLAEGGDRSVLRSWRGGLVARPGDDDPERITLDPRLIGEMPRVTVGDAFELPVVGVLDYSFGVYRVLLTAPPPPIVRRTAPRDRTPLRGDGDHLTIAAWNVLDLGGDDHDGVFRSIARSVVEDLGAPDLVALEEIADASGDRDDGVVAGAPTLERLLAAILAAGGPRYQFRQIDPRDNEDGGAPGANIRVALLFDPARVAFIDRGRPDAVTASAVLPGPSLSVSPGRIEPGDVAWRESRKPLAAELRFGDRRLFVVANHFVSKTEDDPPFGAAQPPVRRSEPRRRLQAALVGRWVRDLLAVDPGAAVVVLGDLNEHWFGEPLAALASAGLEALIARVPLPERYTYVHAGHSQVLDHVFVSRAIAAGAEVDVVHTNADFPAWRRASDHDAVVVRMRLGPDAEANGRTGATRE